MRANHRVTAQKQVIDRTLRAVVRTESGSTYRIDGDTLVLDGPGDRAFQAFSLISLDGARLTYTDGERVYRSSEIVAISTD